jgi:methionine sulfoxide reductase catalytic subunit
MLSVKPSEITPEHIYLSRRKFMVGLGALASGAVALSACGTSAQAPATAAEAGPDPAEAEGLQVSTTSDELGDSLTQFQAVTNFNNFYEFSVDKEAVARVARNFEADPWSVEIGGLVHKPQTIGVEDILANYTQQERVYRLRCVEGWSMVIPWLGFPLAELLQAVEPMSQAKYVRFETIYDPNRMPGQKNGWYTWPYVEGLRLDEAMHPLTILSTGLYGQSLLPQNGAPIRLVVPWKYGFKSIKSIVKIDLVEEAPVSLWMAAAPNEYGFYSNVNPDVPHPRWSQSSERRIGELGRRPTLPFNGYAEEVAQLYDGMDLRVSF